MDQLFEDVAQWLALWAVDQFGNELFLIDSG